MGAPTKRSKKRSAANLASRRPSCPVFLDEGLGSRVVADALRREGVDVRVHREFFKPGTPDSQWLDEAGKRGWIVLSKDRGIKRRAIERQAIERAGVKAFILTAADVTGPQMAEAFIEALPRIKRLSEATDGWLIATVSKGGRVKQLK